MSGPARATVFTRPKVHPGARAGMRHGHISNLAPCRKTIPAGQLGSVRSLRNPRYDTFPERSRG